MRMDIISNLTISLINSDLTSELMRSGYIHFLYRYINKSKGIHEDEIKLIKQNAKKFKIEIADYDEEQLEEVLRNYQKQSRKNAYSNSDDTRQKSQKVDTKKENENSEIKRLNKIISELRQKGKQAVASRDKWRRRAEVAETEVAEREQNQQSQNKENNFKQVKKMFAKMYHPDSLTGDKFEKLIKQEIFKEFWQVIESIEKHDT